MLTVREMWGLAAHHGLQGYSSREGKLLLKPARVVSQYTDEEIAIAAQLLSTPDGQVMARPEFGITHLRSLLTAELNR